MTRTRTSASQSPSSAGNDPRRTPAMRQYDEFKKRHPDCVLFFRMGDFYEMFDDDAVLVSKVLGLTLTQRTAGIPMAGVPHHALEGYLQRMIRQGYRVAVCEQIQDPAEAKGVVDRAVTRVVTPGTLIDEALLDEATANQIAAIQFLDAGEASSAVLAVAEVSTGRFTLHVLDANRVVDELARLGPSELLYVETADGAPPDRVKRLADLTGCSLTARPGWTYRIVDARDLLLEHFGVQTLSGFGLADDDAAIAPAGALLRYLRETQMPDDGATNRLAHLRPPVCETDDAFLMLDAFTLRSLEIERTMRAGQTSGSLLATLQRCVTAMGKRLLRAWLCFPLRDLAAIECRQRAVAAMMEDRTMARTLAEQLGDVQDVARLAGRISVGRASPRDLVALGRSIDRIAALLDLLEERPAFVNQHCALEAVAPALKPLAIAINERCVESPPTHLREGGLFRDGIDAELDEARSLQRDANSWLAAYQKRLIEETDIPSLKIGYNRVFGYYIEVTHAHGAKVPADFSRKQTLKNAERYITTQLREFEEKVTTAQSRAIERERTLFSKLTQQAVSSASALSTFAEICAELDVLQCFAELAVRHRFVKPTIVDAPVLEIAQGRHPVLDQTLGERFVPNDCALGGDEGSGRTLALITGPNMAGKSTYIRQVALIVLLAHTGSYVPAESATIGLTDRIFTRIGASDELHAGQSTFMVEMTETANILHHATERSLVILDEIGRGTSTLDGLALAWAIAESIAHVGCRSLFATHYHELTNLADEFENVCNLHVTVREWGHEIIFLYRILPGRTDRSYGIHVARIAGLPTKTIERAETVLDSLEVQTAAPASPRDEKPSKRQLELFTEYVEHPAMREIRDLDLTRLSPLEAFDTLRSLIDALNDGASDRISSRHT